MHFIASGNEANLRATSTTEPTLSYSEQINSVVCLRAPSDRTMVNIFFIFFFSLSNQINKLLQVVENSGRWLGVLWHFATFLICYADCC